MLGWELRAVEHMSVECSWRVQGNGSLHIMEYNSLGMVIYSRAKSTNREPPPKSHMPSSCGFGDFPGNLYVRKGWVPFLQRAFPLQVLNRVSIILALVSFAAVIAIFGVLVGRGDGVGYAFVISSVVFVSVVPVRTRDSAVYLSPRIHFLSQFRCIRFFVWRSKWVGSLHYDAILAAPRMRSLQLSAVHSVCGATLALICCARLAQIGMPVVTTTVLAVGARKMADEKAIVSR